MANVFNKEVIEIKIGNIIISQGDLPEATEIMVESERDSDTVVARSANGGQVLFKYDTRPGTITISFLPVAGNSTFVGLIDILKASPEQETGSVMTACGMLMTFNKIYLKDYTVSVKTTLEEGDQHQLVLGFNDTDLSL